MIKTDLPTDSKSDVANPPEQIGTMPENNLKAFIIKNKVFIILAIIIIILVPITFLIVSTSKKNQNKIVVSDLEVQAQSAYKSGDYKTAESKLSQALKLNPGDPTILAPIIQAISAQGNQTGTETSSLNTSMPYISQALTSGSNNVDVLISVGYAYETAGQYQKALDYYNRALAINSTSSDAWFHKGHVEEFLGEQQLAFEAYDKAYSLDPKNPFAVTGKARESASKGDVNGTINYYQQLTHLPTASSELKSEAYTNMAALTLSNVLEIKNAVSYAKQANDTDPSYSPAAAEYGFLLAFTGDPRGGLQLLIKAISLNPRISQNYYLLGVTNNGGHLYNDATYYFSAGLSQVENDNTLISQENKLGMTAKLNYENAIALSHLNKQSQALSSLKTALNSNPNLKTQLKIDAQRNMFPGLETNPDFKTLIQS